MRKAIAALALVSAVLIGTIIGWGIDEQPVPDTFIFWGTTNIVASPLIVMEYELEHTLTEITAVKVKVLNTDPTTLHRGAIEVDVISSGTPYSGSSTIPWVPADESKVVTVTLNTAAPINGLTNVYFYLVDD
ncbi:hypothetical protein LCGC14_1625640 [marine sediment metagenome]|uniref:Uncharacterized protein n=1 Tax=marine sediment metagenome TaxID=412755 RepID=A0A0F9I468_9ZZZZ